MTMVQPAHLDPKSLFELHHLELFQSNDRPKALAKSKPIVGAMRVEERRKDGEPVWGAEPEPIPARTPTTSPPKIIKHTISEV